MMSKEYNKDDIFNDFARIFSPGQLEHIRSLGLDIIEGKRQGNYIFDSEGRRYIDCNTSSATFNLGRRPPEIIKELKKTMYETDQGNFPMISREKATLGSMLADFVPGDLECSVFSVIRGETMEFACKLARGYTGRKELITVDGSWYGQTGFALSLSDRADKESFAPLIPEINIIPYGDIDAARRSITTRTAAVIIEPIQVENHCRVADKAYLRGLRVICRERGVILIFDETQTGMGRTGKKFAFEYSGVIPDMLNIGEALGAGVFPIAATVFTQELNTFLNAHPLIHLSTFGGSDLGCRVACKVLEVSGRTRPWENALSMGEKLRDGIEAIMKDNKCIGSVSGMGLMLSMDMRTPEMARVFCRKAATHGILTSPGEAARNTVLIRPALTITADDVDRIIEGISAAVNELG